MASRYEGLLRLLDVTLDLAVSSSLFALSMPSSGSSDP